MEPGPAHPLGAGGKPAPWKKEQRCRGTDTRDSIGALTPAVPETGYLSVLLIIKANMSLLSPLCWFEIFSPSLSVAYKRKDPDYFTVLL